MASYLSSNLTGVGYLIDRTVSKCLVVTVSLLQFDLKEAVKVLICCGCLGDRSDDANEIVECDGCGVTVHEGKRICIHVLHVLS